jgi:hypothetical protein
MKWFWRSLFSRRYSAAVTKHHASDIVEMQKLRKDDTYIMKDIPVNIDASYFIKNQFNVASVNTKAFILILAQFSPKSLLSGANVDLDEVLKRVNRNEFHHIFPRKYLETKGVLLQRINCLANFCFISSSDNQKIKDKAPTDYNKLIPAATLPDVMEHALCPHNALDLDFDDFLSARAEILLNKTKELMR